MPPRRPRDIGTAAETAVVRYLRGAGWPHAERRSLRGTEDAGDVTGTPCLCWQIKGGAAAKTASDSDITAWLAQAEKQRVTAGADHAILVVQREHVGPGRAGLWWAYLDIQDVAQLTNDGIPKWTADSFPVRMHLWAACVLLREADYGDPIQEGTIT